MAVKTLEIIRAWKAKGAPSGSITLRGGKIVSPSLRLIWLDAGAIWLEDWDELAEYRELGTGFIRGDQVLLALCRMFAAYEMGPDDRVSPFDFEIPSLEAAIRYNAAAPKLTDAIDPTPQEWDAELRASGRL